LPTIVTLLPTTSYSGAHSAGPVVVPPQFTGFKVEADRANFVDPATAMAVWVDFSADGALTWLGTPVGDPSFVVGDVTIPRSGIAGAWAFVTGVGDPIYGTNPPKDKLGVVMGMEIDGTMPGGSLRAKGGIVFVGTIVTSVTLTLYP
jgi:hypothetical protein